MGLLFPWYLLPISKLFLIMYSRIRTINVSMFIWESVAIGFDFWRYCEYKFILLFGIVHMAHHAVVPWPTELTWMNQFFIVVPRRGFTQKPHWHWWLSHWHGWLFTSMGGCLTSMGGCLTGIGGCLPSMVGCFTGICGYLTDMGGSLTGIGGCLTGIVTEKKKFSRWLIPQLTSESLLFWENAWTTPGERNPLKKVIFSMAWPLRPYHKIFK